MLVNSKQIQDFPASRIITTEELQFTSKNEKDFWNSNIMLYLGVKENIDSLNSIESPLDGSLVFIKSERIFYIFTDEKWSTLKPNYVYTHLKSVMLPVGEYNQTIFRTGIFNEKGLGLYSKNSDIILSIEGLVQRPTIDYMTSFDGNELVIKYLADDLRLITTDNLVIFFNNTIEEKGNTDFNIHNTDKIVYWDEIQNKPVIGDLENLQTTDKSSLVNAINEVFQFVANGKDLIASAITDKGILTSNIETFTEMSNKIRDIENGDIGITSIFDIRVQDYEPMDEIKDGTIWIRDGIQYEDIVVINDSNHLRMKFEELKLTNKPTLILLLKDNIFEYDKYLVRNANLSQISNQMIDFNGLCIKLYQNGQIFDIDSYVWDGSVWVKSIKRGKLSGGTYIYSTSLNNDIVKYDTHGNIIWERIVPENLGFISGIETDSNKNLFVCVSGHSVFKISIDNVLLWEHSCNARKLLIFQDQIFIITYEDEIIKLDNNGNFISITDIQKGINTDYVVFDDEGRLHAIVGDNSIYKFSNNLILLDTIKSDYNYLKGINVDREGNVITYGSNSYTSGYEVLLYSFIGDTIGRLIYSTTDLNIKYPSKIKRYDKLFEGEDSNERYFFTSYDNGIIIFSKRINDDNLYSISRIHYNSNDFDIDSEGFIYIADNNSFVKKFTLSGFEVECYDYIHPYYSFFVRVSEENPRKNYFTYIVNNDTIVKFDNELQKIIWERQVCYNPNIFNYDNFLYVLDTQNNKVLRIDKDTGVIISYIDIPFNTNEQYYESNFRFSVYNKEVLVISSSNLIIEINLNNFSLSKFLQQDLLPNYYIHDFRILDKYNYLFIAVDTTSDKVYLIKTNRDLVELSKRVLLKADLSSYFYGSDELFISLIDGIYVINKESLTVKKIFEEKDGISDIYITNDNHILLLNNLSVLRKINRQGRLIWSNFFGKHYNGRPVDGFKITESNSNIILHNVIFRPSKVRRPGNHFYDDIFVLVIKDSGIIFNIDTIKDEMIIVGIEMK